MANNDPTAILSAIVAVPIAIAGNLIHQVVSTIWRMKRKAAEALEAGNQLDADLDLMERGQLLQEEHINTGRDLAKELRSVAEDANTISIFNLPRRFVHSRKIDKCLQDYGEYNGTHMILKAIQSLTLQVHERQEVHERQDASFYLLNLQLHERQDASVYLFSPPLCDDSQLIKVGMDNNVARLTSFVLESEIPYISITGMGGIGKSHLARVVCNDQRVQEYFGKSILWVDCGHCDHQDQKLLCMQEKLHFRLTGTEGSFATLARGNQVLRDLIKRQSSQPYLLVLDNVQSRLLMKSFNFLAGGRIQKTIVTSRQQDILRDIDENDKKGLWVGELSEDEAFRLFCMHAFGDGGPPTGLQDYVMEFVEHCGGMPLMLEVLGEYMRPKTRAGEWKCVLKQIKKKKLMHEERDHVFELLRISYDALDVEDKKRFLYLATCSTPHAPIGIQVFHCWRGIDLLSQDEDIDIVKEEYIEALNRLSSASLIRVHNWGPYLGTSFPTYILVSGMIKELADYIVTKDNLLNHSLRRNAGWTEVVHESFICSTAASIEIDYGDNIPSLDYFSHFSNLRSLTLMRLKNLRMFDSAHMDPLSICQLRYLRITFQEPSKLQPLYNALQQLSKLEFLSIYSTRAHAEDTTLDVGFLSNMPELNTLSLDTPLKEVINCHHIQELRKLEGMSLSFFHHWDWPPPKDLKELHMNIRYSEGDRNVMEWNPFMTSLCASTTLEHLVIRGVRFLEVPDSLHLPSLKWLSLEVAKERLPRGWLQSLPCLERLEINGGGKLMELPSLDKLPKLWFIKLSGLAAEQLHITPEESASLSNLERLEIEKCENLKHISTLEFLPSTKFFLELRRCGKLLHLPSNCSSLTLDGLVTLQNMRGCPQVAGKLRTLHVENVATMKHLPELVCPNLKRLEIWRCPEMETLLPDDTRFSSCFPKLTSLKLRELPKLLRLPSSLGDSLPNCKVEVKYCPSLNPPSSQ